MLYVIFGEMGTGKNHVGEKLAEHLHCEFFDGDTVIPKSMIEKVSAFRPLTAKDIDDYVDFHLIPNIARKLGGKEDLVVSQALYRQKHRDLIETLFDEKEVKLIWLPVYSHLTHLKRLYSRENGLKWMYYGLLNKIHFEVPKKSNVKIIDNNENYNEQHLKEQIEILVRYG